MGETWTLRSANTDDVELEQNLSKRAKYINTLLDQWWRRWKKDYLTELREHQKIESKSNAINPTIGDVVLIADDTVKRSQWRIGRITNLFVSNDGKSRSAELLTNDKGTVMNRPVNLLYPITIHKEPTKTDVNK